MISGALVVLLGIFGLTGWLTGAGALARISWHYIPMAQSTAWSCLFLGSSLLLHGSRSLAGRGRGLALGAVLLTTVFGFLNFIEYFVGVDWSLEEVWFPATEHFGRVVTNRMSPMTGAGMFVSGMALSLVLATRPPIRNLSGVLGWLVAMLGLVGTIGYLFGTPLLSGGNVIPMAANTTFALLLLGVGLTAAAGPECWPLRALVGSSVRARLLRTFLPLTGVIILAQGWLNQFIPGLFANPALSAALLALGVAGVMALVVTAAGGRHLQGPGPRQGRPVNRRKRKSPSSTGNWKAASGNALPNWYWLTRNWRRSVIRFPTTCGRRCGVLTAGPWRFWKTMATGWTTRAGPTWTRCAAETQHMGQLIDDMLSLSRVGRVEMQRETVDLSALARAIAGRLRETGPERRVEFVIQEGLTVVGDPHLLEIALFNLLDNAWKFTGKRSGGVIEFGRITQEGHPVFFVRDNGAGFDPAYADKLFGAFQRLHKASEFPGTGIGLVTVQRILHRHGGRVWAEAAVDQGAAFYFTL